MASKAPSKKQAAAKRVATKRSAKLREAEVRDATVTSAGDWKKGKEAARLRVPSGNVCLARAVGMEPFLAKGLIPNALMPIVTRAVEEGKGISAKEVNEITSNLESAEGIADMLAMADAVVVECVVSPHVYPMSDRDAILEDESLTPDEKAAKINSLLFVDEVDINDKMFIFQWAVGGTSNLEQFREKSANVVEDLATGKAVPEKAK